MPPKSKHRAAVLKHLGEDIPIAEQRKLFGLSRSYAYEVQNFDLTNAPLLTETRRSGERAVISEDEVSLIVTFARDNMSVPSGAKRPTLYLAKTKFELWLDYCVNFRRLLQGLLSSNPDLVYQAANASKPTVFQKNLLAVNVSPIKSDFDFDDTPLPSREEDDEASVGDSTNVEGAEVDSATFSASTWRVIPRTYETFYIVLQKNKLKFTSLTKPYECEIHIRAPFWKREHEVIVRAMEKLQEQEEKDRDSDTRMRLKKLGEDLRKSQKKCETAARHERQYEVQRKFVKGIEEQYKKMKCWFMRTLFLNTRLEVTK